MIDIETSYLNRIIELSDELNHYVHQYNSLVLKRKTKEENNAVNINKKEKEKAPKKN